MNPNKITTVENTFAVNHLDSNGVTHFILNTIKLGDGFEIKQIRPKFSSYYYQTKTEKKAICLHFTVGNIKGDIGSLTKADNHVSVNYVVDRLGNIYNLFDDDYWSYHLGSNAIGTNTSMSKQTIGIEISNYGPLKLSTEGKLIDAYGNEYCDIKDEQYYKEVSYRGYDFYATMTEKQEDAIAHLLKYLSKERNIPLVFKENPDQVFKSATEAKEFSGVYYHTSVRKDKFDWPDEMLNGVKEKLKDKPKQKTEAKIEIKQCKDPAFTTTPKINTLYEVDEELVIEKPKSFLDEIYDLLLSLFGKK